MNVVFLYGPPGVGKRTVGLALGSLIGYKLADNHATINLACRFFEFRTESMWKLEHALRSAIFDAAAEANFNLIATFVAANERTMAHASQTVATTQRTGGRTCFVRLHCEQSELEQRLQAPGRKELGKLTSVDVLRGMQAGGDFNLVAPAQHSIEIETTDLDPGETARRIAEHFAIPLLDA